MVAYFDKGSNTGMICKDMKYVAGCIGVHVETLRRHMPYWQTDRFIVFKIESVEKSRRGRVNFTNRGSFV